MYWPIYSRGDSYWMGRKIFVFGRNCFSRLVLGLSFPNKFHTFSKSSYYMFHSFKWLPNFIWRHGHKKFKLTQKNLGGPFSTSGLYWMGSGQYWMGHQGHKLSNVTKSTPKSMNGLLFNIYSCVLSMLLISCRVVKILYLFKVCPIQYPWPAKILAPKSDHEFFSHNILCFTSKSV